MSRIGKKPVTVPEKVNISIENNVINVKGPNGELSYNYDANINVALNDKQIEVTPKNEENKTRALWGLTRTLVDNMVVGVTQGFTRKLVFTGVGYKAAISGNTLTLNLGYSHPIDYELPQGVSAKVAKNEIEINGASKELVGFVAAKVRSFRPPEPYKGKGVRYDDEVIIRKAGKTGAKK